MLGLPTPALTCVRTRVYICRIIFLTGASNNDHDSFPFFFSFSSFCALHRFRRARSALSCYLPLFIPFPLPSFFSTLSILSALGALGGGGACCCREGVEEGAGEGGGDLGFGIWKAVRYWLTSWCASRLDARGAATVWR